MSWVEAPALRALIERAAHRLAWLSAAEGAAAGLMIAVIAAFAGVPAPGNALALIATATALAVLGAVTHVAATRASRRRVALDIDRRMPAARNVIVTAAELIERPGNVRPYIGARVCAEASRLAAAADPASLFPARRTTLALLAAIAVWSLALLRAAPDVTVSADGIAVTGGGAAIDAVRVTVVPPAYTAGGAESAMDPARLTVLAGSRLMLSVRARAATVTIETVSGSQTLEREGDTFSGEVPVESDGFLALEPVSADGTAGLRTLIGITAIPDDAPHVRITEPETDLFLPAADRSIDIAVGADDDIAIASLTLRLTRVSGSGEQFTFTDGELPLAIERGDDRTWTGRATLRLDTLGLGPGDVLVYRGVATDGRPGRAAVESDARLVEIAAPGAIAMDGFAIDDEQDRYAISQQMVILETERLRAAQGGITADSLDRASLVLAALQRSVRAEFVFMMGGELAEEVEQAAAGIGDLDEESHAEADDEAIAGRLENQGRVALIRAIRSMSRAYDALTRSALEEALTEERLALDQLQAAFSRTRYILRALTQREQLDPARRLTGALDDAGRDVRPSAQPSPDQRLAALRDALAGVVEIARTPAFDGRTARRAVTLAESLLRSSPSDSTLQSVAARLTDAGQAMQTGRAAAARESLDAAARALADAMMESLPAAPPERVPLGLYRLEGERADRLRRGGGR